jgi:hypothetical protein
MAANTAPIFSEAPFISTAVWLPATTANTKSDGTGTIGTDILLLHTPGTDGSFLSRLRLMPTASAAATATTGTVARVYLSTVNSGSTTSANTKLIAELALASQSADSASAAILVQDLILNFPIPANQYVLVSMHHSAAANTGWHFVLIGGNY